MRWSGRSPWLPQITGTTPPLLELAVLARDEATANEHLAATLAAIREPWEPETTVRNLRLIREARERRGEHVGWLLEMEMALKNKRTTK